MRGLLVVAALLGGACSKDSGPPQAPAASPTASPGTDKSLTAGVVPPAAAAPAAGGQPTRALLAEPGQEAAGGGDSCRPAVDHLYTIIPGADPNNKQADLDQCVREHWPAAFLDCSKTVASVADWQATCWKRAFEGGALDLKPNRTFDAIQNAQGAYADVTPPPLTQDGDLLTGGSCNSLSKVVGPATGIFVICDGSVVAGPLTTVDEIKGVFAEISRQSETAYQIGRNIRAHWPTGCSNCKYRVYDGNGNWLRDE